MDALSDYKYLCTNIKNAGNVIAFPAFFHIFAFEERKLSLQDILEFEEALCLSCNFENVGNFQKNVQGWHSGSHA